MTSRGRTTTVAVLLLPAIALAYLVLDLWQVLRVPPPSDLRAAAERVRAQHQPGDAVIFDPSWAWAGAPEFGGLGVSLAEAPDWYELAKHPRLWRVASLGRGLSPLPPGWSPLVTEEVGGVTLELAAPPPAGRLLYDFRERIADARVAKVRPGGAREESRSFREGRWYHGPVVSWQYVGWRRIDIGGTVRDVIWAHALPGEEVVEVRYPGVPLGSHLVVHYGLGQRSLDAENPGTPVAFEVRIGNALAMRRVLGPADGTWYEEALDVSALAGTTAEVTFSVSTINNAFRQFCFTADSWDDTAAAAPP